MANEKNLEKGKDTRFSRENQPEKRGRKPSRLKKFIKEYDIPLSDVQTLITNMMFTYTFDEINELAQKSGSLPVAVGIIIKGLAEDINTGKISIFDKLLDRSFGKPLPANSGIQHISVEVSPEIKRSLKAIFDEELDG